MSKYLGHNEPIIQRFADEVLTEQKKVNLQHKGAFETIASFLIHLFRFLHKTQKLLCNN